MKKIAKRVLLICVILFSPMAALAQEATPTLDSVIRGLSVELSLDRNEYNANQPVKITFKIKNHSKVPAYILKWATPLEGFTADLFEVTKKDQKTPLPYLGIMASRIGPYPESYVRLEANGGSATRTLDLSTGYALVAAGDYRLTYKTRILDVSLEYPVYKPDRLFRGGIKKTIALEFRLSANRKSPVVERPRTAKMPLAQQRPFDSTGLFPYFNGPGFDPTREYASWRIGDVNKQALLRQVYREALKKAAEAKVVLNGTPYEEIARAVERFGAYFGTPDPGRWKEIVNIYGTIYSFGFETDPGKIVTFLEGDSSGCANSDLPAYTDPTDMVGGLRYIHICPVFWDDARLPFLPNGSTGSDSKVGIVLHEMSHLAGGQSEGLLLIVDNKYGESNCIRVAHADPVEACGNADNYHLFAMNLHGLTMGLDRPRLMLETGSGGYVSAKNGGGGSLDACGKQDLEGVFALSSSKENKLTFGADGTPHWISNWTPFIPSAGDRVKLVTANRKHVVFAPGPGQYQDQGSSVHVGADGSDSSSWMIRKASGGTVHSGDSISLQAPNDSYLATTGSCGSGSVIARASANITPDMKFTAMTPKGVSEYYVHLRSADGHYLSAKRSVWPLSRLLWDIVVSTSETDSIHCPQCTFILAVPQGTSRSPVLMTYDGVHFLAHRQGRGAEIAAVKSIATPYVGITIENPQAVRTGDVVTLRTTDNSQQWRFIMEIAR